MKLLVFIISLFLCASCEAQTISFSLTSTPSLNFPSNIIYSGAGGPPNVWQAVYGRTLSGNLSSPDATGTTAPLQFYVGSDTVTGIGLAVMQVEDGIAAGFAGGRIAIQGKLVINGVPSTAPSSGLTGITGQSTINANLTGTTGVYTNYLGTVFGSNHQVIATGNATFISLINSEENDVECQSSCTTAEKHAATFVKTANDATRAVYDDSALEIADQNQASPVGWKYGISFGGYAHQNAFTNTSTYIVSQQRQVPSTDTPAANIGIDFSATTFTTAFLKSVGYIVDPSGNTLTTATVAPTMATGTNAVTGLIAPPSLGANDEGVSFVTAANGLDLEGQGTTYDVSFLNNAGVLAAGVIHGQSWFEVPNLLALGTNTFLTVGDILSVTKTNNGDGGMTITNPAGSGNTAAFTAINIGNSTSVNEALISLNGGFSTATNGANALTISTAGVLFLQGGSNTQGGVNVGLKITTGTVNLPNVATGTPAASLCLDASGNIIKKTTTGSCI